MLLREIAYVPLTLVRQYGSRAGLRRYQLRRLNRMLAHANRNVPYYRGTLPRLGSLDDLARLPMVTKAVMRATPNRDFVADGVDTDACMEWSSSGTTGVRVTGWHDLNAHDYHMAACVRRFFATRRYLPTDRLAHIKPFPMPGRPIDGCRHGWAGMRPCRPDKSSLVWKTNELAATSPSMSPVLRMRFSVS